MRRKRVKTSGGKYATFGERIATGKEWWNLGRLVEEWRDSTEYAQLQSKPREDVEGTESAWDANGFLRANAHTNSVRIEIPPDICSEAERKRKNERKGAS